MLTPDYCPHGDFSPSRYDGDCGSAPSPVEKQPDPKDGEQSIPDPGKEHGTSAPGEYETAYQRAYRHNITTMPTLSAARSFDTLTRAETAKMISVYAQTFMHKRLDATKVAQCSVFNDIYEISGELQ